MGTLIYSPGVKVVIQTAGHGIIDVSEDLQTGSLRLAENQPSQFTFTLVNHRRKYDGIFTPNDVISVRMKRVRWLPVFAGYLDQVPYFSVYPRNIELRATDTLKRLKYRLWDPGTPESVSLLSGSLNTNPRGDQNDGGLRDTLIQVLDRVGEWPLRNIHIGRVPDDWVNRLADIAAKLPEATAESLGIDGVVYGDSASSAGSTTAPTSPTVPEGSGYQSGGGGGGKGTGSIPVARGRVTNAAAFGKALLTGEDLSRPRDPWYAEVRLPYANPSTMGTTPAQGFSQSEYDAGARWWRNRLVLVTNPMNSRSVVARVVGWGPLGTAGAKMSLSPRAMQSLGATKNSTVLTMKFAPSGAKPGPVAVKSSGGGKGSNTGLPNLGRPDKLEGAGKTPPPTTPRTVPGSSGEGVGDRLTSDENLRPHVGAARAFIRANWDIPWGIGGYAPRSTPGVSVTSDHFYGLALDVMVTEPGTRAEGADATKGDLIAGWFAANPLVHGVEYVIWHDKINFGEGWQPYGDPEGGSDQEQHRDHIHISFDDSAMPLPSEVTTEMPYTEVGIIQDPGAV